eukprot:TRINITY_DN3393_c0_g1_i1.p1 TRINITY_DN3393_c0_g1~~TRINITY_DN3393_c0_g1_i1.p1  ORF type:complete len:211 (-),score=46.69 TRINITY_DN3393_c0_g1_i1:300-860(-)
MSSFRFAFLLLSVILQFSIVQTFLAGRIMEKVRSRNSSIPDSSYADMAVAIKKALDGVTGHDFVWNWIAMLSENVVVCYPFVGEINPTYCVFGLQEVKKAFGAGPFTNNTAIEQTSFYLSKNGGKTFGVWGYTTSAAYINSNNKACVVQFQGTVMFQLDENDHSKLSAWHEVPDSNRISSTYPCKL